MTITIHADADFTPKGKRAFRVVTTSNGGQQLRWYVSGRIYNKLPVTPDNLSLTAAWLASKTTHEVPVEG